MPSVQKSYCAIGSLCPSRVTDLKLFHQNIFGKIQINHNNSYSIKQTKTRGEKYKIQPTRCSTMIQYNSFFIRTARIYSLIPIEIRKNTPQTFSKLLA
ncbi:unnamed protein product [Meloidogyne enterolobii]|uniref:Uncharacterized protein n=1 Tax=Meloidogyne enterolobii TaxID=390850 RepID=A0ACB0ZM66_MELEN